MIIEESKLAKGSFWKYLYSVWAHLSTCVKYKFYFKLLCRKYQWRQHQYL